MENIIMDKKLYSACPDGVNEKQKEVFSALDALGISYEAALHESIGTIEGLLEVCDLLGASIHKNLFLCNRQKTDSGENSRAGAASGTSRILSCASKRDYQYSYNLIS